MSDLGRCPCGGRIRQLAQSPMYQCDACGFGFPQEERMQNYRSMTVEQGFQAKWHQYEQEARGGESD